MKTRYEIFHTPPDNCEVGHKFAVHADPSPTTPNWVFENSEGNNFKSPSECSDYIPLEESTSTPIGKIKVVERELALINELIGKPGCTVFCLVRCQNNTAFSRDKLPQENDNRLGSLS